MGSRFMDYPSPRGVHVPETYYSNDPDDPYRRPASRRNRYSRSVHQTPRIRDVTWISSPDPTPQTPHAPPSPWLPPPQMPSSPAHRPPSPAPTVGEHMTVDELAFTLDDIVDPYHRPHRPGLIKSFWKGLKKLSGFQPAPSFPIPRPSSYESQTVAFPVPGMSAPSEATQYVNPTTPGTRTGTVTPYTSPYERPANVGATPAIIPGSLRASPFPVPSMEIPPPITIVSPSIPPSPLPNSIRSVRMATPGPAPRTLSVGAPDPVGSTEESSQTLHEPVYPDPALPPLSLPLNSAPIPVPRTDDDPKIPLPPTGSNMPSPAVERSSSKGSLASTMARFRRFVADLDDLPWVSDMQIADEYVPERNPRSRLRTRMRQGAEPSWYNPRSEVVERPAYWSEWDMWAKQSTAVLLDAGREGRVGGWAGAGAGGQVVYPHGYVPAQPGFMYPSGYPPPGVMSNRGYAPVLP